MYYDFREYSELYHHGILGMHWGIRRFQNPDGSLTPKGEKRYSDGKKASKEEKYFNDRNKAIAKSNNPKKTKVEPVGKKAFGRDPSKDKVMTMDDVLDVGNYEKAIQEYVRYGSYKPENEKSYRKNCPNCTLALELKKRGINDLIPLPSIKGMTMPETRQIYKGEKIARYSTRKQLLNADSYGPPGSHGAIEIMDNQLSSGHILNYTVLKDGTIQIEDSQVGKIYTLNDVIKKNELAGFDINASSGYIIDLTYAEIDLQAAYDNGMLQPKTENARKKLINYKNEVDSRNLMLEGVGNFTANILKDIKNLKNIKNSKKGSIPLSKVKKTNNFLNTITKNFSK